MSEQIFIPYGTDIEKDRIIDNLIDTEVFKLISEHYGIDKIIELNNPKYNCAIANECIWLDVLLENKDAEVRQAVAEQGYGLDILINDANCAVRNEVANQGFGYDKLINDKDYDISKTVKKSLFAEGYNNISDWISNNPNRCALPENQGRKSAKKVGREQIKASIQPTEHPFKPTINKEDR